MSNMYSGFNLSRQKEHQSIWRITEKPTIVQIMNKDDMVQSHTEMCGPQRMNPNVWPLNTSTTNDQIPNNLRWTLSLMLMLPC